MQNIKRLDEFTPPHNDTSGGKGKSLSLMLGANINVPDGFVILSTTFDNFIKSGNLELEINTILEGVNKNKMHTVEHASGQIQELILKTEFPKELNEEIISLYENMNLDLVAVRSSATAEDGIEHAWAGQLDSFLNTDKNNLILNIQKCWASLYTPRAIFYRFQKELNTYAISVAVVVQKMIQSEISGIAFSVHPISQDENESIIEAGYGLGEAIVSNKVTPDSYTVKKDTLEILDVYISEQNKKLVLGNDNKNEWQTVSPEVGEKQKLNEEQIKELATVIIQIENFYERPQDIEWAYFENKFYVTQSRPITTLT